MSISTLHHNIQIDISLSILEIECSAFNFTDHAKANRIPILIDDYEFLFSASFKLIEHAKQAMVSLDVALFEKKADNSKLKLAELSSSSLFFIQNFEEIIQRDAETGNSLIPNPLIEICSGIAVSSIRGMFSVKMKDSIYANAVVPLINPKNLLPASPTSIA